MKPERWHQIDTIFQAALKRDRSSRATFLDGARLDDGEVRSEVESLLAAHDQGGSFIHSPAAEVAAELIEHNEPDSLAGRSIGPYNMA